MILALVFCAGLRFLSQNACAQDLVFSADAAIAVDNTGEAGAEAGAENVAAEEVSGDDGPGPLPDLARQDLIPVGTFPRTCNCSTPRTVVCRLDACSQLCQSCSKAMCFHASKQLLLLLDVGLPPRTCLSIQVDLYPIPDGSAAFSQRSHGYTACVIKPG